MRKEAAGRKKAAVAAAATAAAAASFAATTGEPEVVSCQRISDRGRGGVKAEDMEGCLDGRRRKETEGDGRRWKEVEGLVGEAIAVVDAHSSTSPQQQEDSPKSPAAMRAAAHDPKSPAGMRAATHDDETLSGPRRSTPTGATHATASAASSLQAASEPVHGSPLGQTASDEAYTYYDDPHAKTSSKGHSHLEASAISYWQAKQRVGTGRRAVKSHPWDIKKRVTSIYGDAFQQL